MKKNPKQIISLSASLVMQEHYFDLQILIAKFQNAPVACVEAEKKLDIVD